MYSSTGDSNNRTGADKNACRQRFKGIETFLRRIAFNLGNSPSQTEVKIISCIPIDVTDLQNKIISLERQLFEATNAKGSAKQVPVHTATIEPAERNTNTVLSCKCSDVKPLALGDESTMPSQYVDGSSKTRKSTVSFLFPTTSSNGLQQNQPVMTAHNWIEKESIDTSVDGRKRFFRRCKKKKCGKKKDHHKTQLVYYAQTDNSPFTSYGMSTDAPFLGHLKPKVDDVFSKTYLENVIQRHFDPERVVEEFSDTSNFTSPVCRDYHSRVHCPLYESDVCSCCHGHFQDVDRYLCKNQNFIVEPIATHLHKEFNKDIYYDSNLYDIVPVKEKAVKMPKDDKLQIKEPKHALDIRCWPEIARTKPRHQTTAVHHQPKIRTKVKNSKKPTRHLQNARDTIKFKMPNQYRDNELDKREGPTDTSNSFCIDCSEIYPKPMFGAHKPNKAELEPTRTVLRKNAECLTIDVNPKNLTITRSIQMDINSTETKTEETLNQIKSILQSVLAEVKTNPQVNHLPEAKSKKDAIIQQGPSQSNIQACSSLLHSFTYNNSCSANPYVATCSRQITSPFCFTSVPHHRPNCTQNFPLLIQTPGHQKCGCFYKSSSHKTTPPQKQAANMATNTEIDKQESQIGETEKLIKEIYKSIALNMDFQKETSNSEYDELKSVTNNYTDASDPKRLRSTIVAMSDAKTGPTMTTFSTTTVRSNYNASVLDLKPDANRKEVEHYLDYESQSTDHEILDAEINNRNKMNIASTISEHYSDELTTEDESEGEAENVEAMEDVKDKNEKKGLFQRMLGSVKLFNKHKQKEIKGNKKQDVANKVNNDKLESDSDDYQTIYSEKISRPEQRLRRRQYKPRTYATYRPQQENLSRVKTNRRSPYMEQEYRRRWNEQLMFQGNSARRYSSERPYSYQQSPVYWQNYEARSAMVDHRVPNQHTYSAIYNPPPNTVIHKVEQRTSPLNIENTKEAKSKFSWLKKHKLGISQCGEQWKKFILEN